MKSIIDRCRLAWKIIKGEDFMLITRDKEQWQVANTFKGNEIATSGKAIYLN